MKKTLHTKLKNNINRKILFNESMKKYTTFGIGGNVDALIYPSDKERVCTGASKVILIFSLLVSFIYNTEFSFAT